MDKDKLIWNEEDRKQVFKGRIFSVWESYCKSPCSDQAKNGKIQTFSLIDTKDWVMVIPVLENHEPEVTGRQFVMVRQWRFGSKSLSLEFPGGVMEEGETPEETGKRELFEETGYKPARIKKLGSFSPNPAIMTNKIHFYLAEGLTKEGKQNLDEDEYVEIEIVDEKEVIQGIGKEPYIHALMGTALSLYLTRE